MKSLFNVQKCDDINKYDIPEILLNLSSRGNKKIGKCVLKLITPLKHFSDKDSVQNTDVITLQ